MTSSQLSNPPARGRSLAAACLRAALMTALMTALMALGGCDKPGPRPRAMQTVKLLPDTPPPPPREEARPELQKQDRPQPQAPQVKPAPAPPTPQALRSDETAGNGPGNGMVAGAVSQDYSNQALGASIGGDGSGDNAMQRLAAKAYANAATRALNEFLARDKNLRRAAFRGKVQLWLTPSGELQRVDLLDGTGDAQTDQTLRAALTRFPGTTLPPPEGMPQPLRLLVTNRMIG